MEVKGNLILKEDLDIGDEDLEVEGNIVCEGGLWDIKAMNINAGNINACNIKAWDIKAGDINAGNINAGNINAGNINACNIKAWDIKAGNINAWDIKAGDINAGDINAGDINYHAVCFAYNNIVCKSIKGRRSNSKHFVLDGKIKIKGAKGKWINKKYMDY